MLRSLIRPYKLHIEPTNSSNERLTDTVVYRMLTYTNRNDHGSRCLPLSLAAFGLSNVSPPKHLKNHILSSCICMVAVGPDPPPAEDH